MEFYNTTMKVLTDLGADTKQMLVVFNKVDKLSDPSALFALRRHFPDAVAVSAKTGEGMEELIERISEFVARGAMTISLRLPSARADLHARLHREGSVRDVQYDEEGFTFVTATIPTRSLELFAPFLAVPEPVPVDEPVPSSDRASS
jgi:GTP-binding protein HflX